MPRPRKDGKPAARAVRLGKRRVATAGRPWQAKGYAPTPGAPYGRVAYLNANTERWTSAVPIEGQTLDEKFDEIERWLDQGVALGRGGSGAAEVDGDQTAASTRRDIAGLVVLYLAWLVKNGRSPDYIANRRSLINKWVLPVIATLLVADWGPEASLDVISNAREHLSPSRLQDLGSVLSGLRATAHRKRPGGRWLSPDDNPLDGVGYASAGGTQGASAKYVPPHRRPETEMVPKAISAAAESGRWEWLPDVISVAAFCALRQGEQLGLRAVDVDLRERVLDVNGVWLTSPSGKRAGQGKVRVGQRRAYTKNGKRRTAPYAASQHEVLRRRVAIAFGLPEDAHNETLVRRVDAERAARAALTKTGDWRDAAVPAIAEPWLFPGEDGLPPSREQFNGAWRAVRDAIGWNRSIPYRTLRHHAILWWKANVPDLTWADIADWSGHTVKTLEAYYIIPSENATKKARASLDKL